MSPVADLDRLFVGRDAEMAVFASEFEASFRGGRSLSVAGRAGVGKSTLLRAFDASVGAWGGVFALGRHRETDPEPFAALGAVLRELVQVMLALPVVERDGWLHEVRATLDPAPDALLSLVPELRALVDARTSDGDGDVRHQLSLATTRLVEATAQVRPTVLAFDDMQWADRDAQAMVQAIAATRSRSVLVVLAQRNEDDPPRPPLPPCDVTVALEDFDLRSTRALLEAMASASGLHGVAREVHRTTHGNPLHIRQLVERAHREGVLRRTDSGWEWDEPKLADLSGSETMVDLIVDSLDHLPDEAATIVGALACIDAEFDLGEAVVATGRSAAEVSDAVRTAIEAGIIRPTTEVGAVAGRHLRYQLSHDRIAEAARSTCPAGTATAVHRRLFVERASQPGIGALDLGRHVLVAADDLPEEYRRRAVETCLDAGNVAIERSSYNLAISFHETGARLAPSTGADDLTALLRLGAARASYLLGGEEGFSRVHEIVADAADEPGDDAEQTALRIIELNSHAAEGELAAAIEVGRRALDDLEVQLPTSRGDAALLWAILRTRAKLRRWDDARFLALPRCTDERIELAQQVLAALRNVAYLQNDDANLFPTVVLIELELTLEHGLVPSTPVALASYAVLLASLDEYRFSDYEAAQRFIDVALALARRGTDPDGVHSGRPAADSALPDHPDLSQITFLAQNFVRHWREPMRDGLARLHVAYSDSLERGHPEYAGFTAAVLLYQSFWLGRPLNEIDLVARSLIPAVRTQEVPRLLCQSTQQMCLNLLGRTSDPRLLAGESGYDEATVQADPVMRDNVVLHSAWAITKLGLHFWHGDYEECVGYAALVEQVRLGLRGTSNVQLFHMVNSISRLHARPDERSTRRATRAALRRHRAWAAGAASNYGASCELLEGLWTLHRARQTRFRSRRDRLLRAAESRLREAERLAVEYQLPLIRGLALEHLAELLVEGGREPEAGYHTKEAFLQWRQVGMAARSERLLAQHPWLLAEHATKVDPTTTAAIPGIDQATSREDMEALALDAAIQVADATRGYVVARDGASLAVVAMSGDTPRDEPTTAPTPVPSRLATVIHPVMRHRQPLRFHDASGVADTPGTTGSARATLTIPLVENGDAVGAIHVEHSTEAGKFDDRAEARLVDIGRDLMLHAERLRLRAEVEQARANERELRELQDQFIGSDVLRLLGVEDIRRLRLDHAATREVGVLISDIRGYTTLIEQLSEAEAGSLITDFLRSIELPIFDNNGYIQDLRGDEVLAIFDGVAEDAIRAGLAMQSALRRHNLLRREKGAPEIAIGVGITHGQVAIEVVRGVNRRTITIRGDAVNLAARIESSNKRYNTSVLIEGQLHDRLEANHPFSIRRVEHVVPLNRTRPARVYEVYDGDPDQLRAAKDAARPMFEQAFEAFDRGDLALARPAFERCRDLLPHDVVATLHLDACDAIERGELGAGEAIALREK